MGDLLERWPIQQDIEAPAWRTMSDTEPEPVMVILRFETDHAAQLASVLSKYVVLSRSHRGCHNIDFVSSSTSPGRLVIVEKWDSAEVQQAHFDSLEMVEMAQACEGLLSRAPDIDLFEGVSMHDLA